MWEAVGEEHYLVPLMARMSVRDVRLFCRRLGECCIAGGQVRPCVI